MAAIYFREKEYQDAIDNYKDALALVAKTGEGNKFHSDRIVNKLAQAVEYQLKLRTASEKVFGMDTMDSGTAKGRRVGRRRRGRPKYGKVNSLVAKGLEETTDEEEESASSFYDSETESNKTHSSSSVSEEKPSTKIETREGFQDSRGAEEENESPGDREGYRESSETNEAYRESPGIREAPGDINISRNGRYHTTYSSPLLENSMSELPPRNGNVRHLEQEERQARNDEERKQNAQKTQSKMCVIQ